MILADTAFGSAGDLIPMFVVVMQTLLGRGWTYPSKQNQRNQNQILKSNCLFLD
jgi:hypothetical protein